MTAATYSAGRPGRTWRSVEDTTNDPIIASRRPQAWTSWQRSEDYYSEGQLVWLDADTLIREKSGGKKTLDDFARLFFGIDDGSWTTVTYTFDDVVAGLNKVLPYDWAGFLNARINSVSPQYPLDGLARSGYRLVYADAATDYWKQNEAIRKLVDLTYSIGLTLRDGSVASVLWDGPAYKAGLAVGDKFIAVNGVAYDAERLKETITAAKSGVPISLIVQVRRPLPGRIRRVARRPPLSTPRTHRRNPRPPLRDLRAEVGGGFSFFDRQVMAGLAPAMTAGRGGISELLGNPPIGGESQAAGGQVGRRDQPGGWLRQQGG